MIYQHHPDKYGFPNTIKYISRLLKQQVNIYHENCNSNVDKMLQTLTSLETVTVKR